MAFPTIQATSQGATAEGTSHVINMPAGIQVGDLLLVFFGTDGDNTITNWGGFTELDQQWDTRDIFGAVAFKVAVGSDTLTITTSVGEPGSHIVYRIDGWESDFIPEISTFTYGNANIPDPAIVTPSWIQDDTLWIAVCMNDNDSVVSAYPTNYSLSQLNQVGIKAGCGIGICGRNLNASSENPGVFTLDDPEQWFAWTIAVAPSGASAPTGGYTVGLNRGINRGIL